MTKTLTPTEPTQWIDLDALEAAFRLPAVEPRRTVGAALVADAPRESLTAGEWTACALFAALLLSGVALVVQSLAG